LVLEWNNYFLEMAKTASLRSNCIRAQVGAIIVNEGKFIVATGYNGTPSGVTSCVDKKYCYRIENSIPSGTRYEDCQSLHAEMNAIIQAGIPKCKGSTMYIYGHSFVCVLCKRFIVQSGITGVYLRKDELSEIRYIPISTIKKELEDSL